MTIAASPLEEAVLLGGPVINHLRITTMKLNEKDIRTLNRLMAAERLIKEAMIGDEEDNAPDVNTIYSMIHDMGDLLHESAAIIKEIGDLVKHYEANGWESDDEEDFDDDDLSFMVMIVEPGEEFAVLTEDEAMEMYSELFPRGDSSKELISIPNIPLFNHHGKIRFVDMCNDLILPTSKSCANPHECKGNALKNGSCSIRHASEAQGRL